MELRTREATDCEEADIKRRLIGAIRRPFAIPQRGERRTPAGRATPPPSPAERETKNAFFGAEPPYILPRPDLHKISQMSQRSPDDTDGSCSNPFSSHPSVKCTQPIVFREETKMHLYYPGSVRWKIRLVSLQNVIFRPGKAGLHKA